VEMLKKMRKIESVIHSRQSFGWWVKEARLDGEEGDH
jgi:hypothetical protein